MDLSSLRMTDGDWMTKVCFVFKQVSHAREQEVCEKLNQFYDEKSPDDFPMVEDIFGGAAWQMINNNPDEALIWIDHLIERKLAFLKLTTQPVFTPLVYHPGFAARLQRIEMNAEQHKNAIKDAVVKL